VANLSDLVERSAGYFSGERSMSQIASSLLMGREEKIQGRHFERLAIVYVRQSTMQQVQRHQESTRLSTAWCSLLSTLDGRVNALW